MEWKPYAVRENIRITEIYSFFKIHHGECFEFTGETHNFWEAMYVVGGTLCVSADEKIYHLKEGNLIFHKPLELHRFHVTDPGGAIIVVLSFSARGILTDYFKNKVFSLTDEQKEVVSSIIMCAEANCEIDGDDYTRYRRGFETDDIYVQTIASRAELLMLSLISNSDIQPVLRNDDSRLFAKAVNYMNEKISENPSVSEISAHVNMSTSGLKRLFAKYAGLGVHKYFLKLKLKRAIELIDRGYSVTAVSERLNFSSQGYFTKVFKRETGYLPSERKQGRYERFFKL